LAVGPERPARSVSAPPTMTQTPRVTVAQLGARRHYAVPRIVHGAGMLERFFTDSYSGDKPRLRAAVAVGDRVFPTAAAKRWLARRDASLPADKITSFERLGWRYARAQRRAANAGALGAVFARYGAAFNAAVLRHGLRDADVVFGFNGAARELFEAARREGRRCVLDQTIAPLAVQHRLLDREKARWPDWQPDWAPEPPDPARLEREAAEWAPADLILCPSAFVRDAIGDVGGPLAKCALVPYGTDPARFPPAARREPPAGFGSCSRAKWGCARAFRNCWRRCDGSAPSGWRRASSVTSASPGSASRPTPTSRRSPAPSRARPWRRTTPGPMSSSFPPCAKGARPSSRKRWPGGCR